jgi:hypothetical protein
VDLVLLNANLQEMVSVRAAIAFSTSVSNYGKLKVGAFANLCCVLVLIA